VKLRNIQNFKLNLENKLSSRMIEDANRVGADAVVNVRFMTSVISQGAAEVLAYGTSVKLK
jgi:uncharacterized protein YbjQ (UPF0145 family)